LIARIIDHAIVLNEREHVLPVRPTLNEIRLYLRGAPLSNWTESAHRFAGMDSLAAGDHKAFIRTLLYPARLVYSWTTGRMASNDEAVAFTCEHRPPGMNIDILTKAFACREAAADPDALFSRTDRPAGSGQILHPTRYLIASIAPDLDCVVLALQSGKGMMSASDAVDGSSTGT